MGTHMLQVEGALTFTDVQLITGNGEAVISLQGAGTLTLSGSDGNTDEGTISNTNYSGKNHYAIAVASSSNPIIIWNDDKLKIQSVKESRANSYIIEGCDITEDSAYFVKDWLKCKTGYSVKVLQDGVAGLEAK